MFQNLRRKAGFLSTNYKDVFSFCYRVAGMVLGNWHLDVFMGIIERDKAIY